MKRIVLTLCVFIALSSLADAARFYKCVDRDGNTIMTDNPPPDAKCESRGATPDPTPAERMQREYEEKVTEQERRDRRKETLDANRRFNQVKKDMSQADVKKILGPPFHSEVLPRGNSYVEKWIYPRDGEADCIVRFYCSPTQCYVTEVIK